MADPYSTLGVTKTASDAEIKSAYRRAKNCIPTEQGQSEGVGTLFRRQGL